MVIYCETPKDDVLAWNAQREAGKWDTTMYVHSCSYFYFESGDYALSPSARTLSVSSTLLLTFRLSLGYYQDTRTHNALRAA